MVMNFIIFLPGSCSLLGLPHLGLYSRISFIIWSHVLSLWSQRVPRPSVVHTSGISLSGQPHPPSEISSKARTSGLLTGSWVRSCRPLLAANPVLFRDQSTQD